MRTAARAWLELVRLPNVLTAMADVLAGALYAGAVWADAATVLPLTAASAMLYAGGVALNDVCDIQQDARDRPGRPIPSGRISWAVALGIAIALLLAGSGLAFVTGPQAGGLAVAIAATAAAYNAVFKLTVLGPVLMGACRALNLALGVSVASDLTRLRALVPIILIWVYIASVTWFARTEVSPHSRPALTVGASGVALATVGLAVIAPLGGMDLSYLLGVALLTVMLTYRGIAAIQEFDPPAVQKAVKTFVLSLVLFDALLVWAARGPMTAFPVALLLPLAYLLSRRVRVT